VNRWLVALPMLAVGVFISGGDAAAAGSLIEAVADALSPTKAPLRASAQEKKPDASRVHHRHILVRRPKPQKPDPLTAFAKAPPSDFVDAHAMAADDEDKTLKPRSVATIRVLPPAARLDTLEEAVALSTDDGNRTPSIKPFTQRSLARSGATELMMLLSTCAGAALAIYGLVAFNSRRRISRASQTTSPRLYETCSIRGSTSQSIGSPKTISAPGRNLIFEC
jgi:hypothetical protein